jgi:DNA-binding transcriptional LysR family regulator
LPLGKIDLNLFRVFEAVMQHRSISKASDDLHLTPSAVSHALGRLRQALGDDLFVFGDQGMEPTARAIALAPSIRNGLSSLAEALSGGAFDPSQALRTFRLVTSDYAALTLLPLLVARLAKDAPQIDLRVFPANRIDVIRHLDDGRVDAVLGWFEDLPDRLQRMPLLEEAEAVVVRTGHALTRQPVSEAALLAYPHVVVALTGSDSDGGDGFYDERGATRRVWLERLLIEKDADTIGRVAVSVPHFSMVPALVEATDMVATLPRRLARRWAEERPLALLDLPYTPLRVVLDLVMHQRAAQDPGLQWLGQVLQEIATGL